ncbi:MAG: class I poly(R)-hydroxyalkanoic acid synthase, partial [Acetobacteraceae bacterium]|nr:class I poly(R)-hydroxyalkanoic acid synthase [Acetobacteraceae bacterium]
MANDPTRASSGSAEGMIGVPGPEMMLGLWSSWMKSHTGGDQDWFGSGKPWWQITSDDALGNMLAGGVKQLNETVAKDPLLHSVDEVWNANPLRDVIPVDWAEIARALRTVWMRSMANPAQAATAAMQFGSNAWNAAISAWNEAGQRWWDSFTGKTEPQSQAPRKGGDKRFAAPEWQVNPVYRTMRDVYLLASDWLLKQSEVLDMEPAEKQRVNFHLRQFVDAMSPSLQLLSNPEALRRAMETGGASLAEGARNLLEDVKAGRLSMVDATAFAPGRNLALSEGKIVHRNKLVELIQYAPNSETVHKTPLMILPPWINKYYIMDLQPKNSMVKWLTEQGFTVYMVSWKNPDASMDGITIEDYVDLGVLETSDVVRDITGVPRINSMGYCIGGTLQALTLAWLGAKNDDRINAATFMVSLQDFSRVGDTAVFMEEEKIDFVEQQMMQRGYLDRREMANMFNLLRSNDLIWSNVVNNYLLGQKPPAFDLLYWNSDGTRMTPIAHQWYLRNTYIENNLIIPGKVQLKGEAIDLGRIEQDVYAVGAEKDHIVPWDAAWRITQLAGGKVRYVLASSGHIAGIINPPGGKGTYWTNDKPAATPAEWRKSATAHDGSWWSDWKQWLADRSGERVAPPPMGNEKHPP